MVHFSKLFARLLKIGTGTEPIRTSVRHSKASAPMKFNINESTEISFRGDRFVHTYIAHQFSFDRENPQDSNMLLHLEARARQFSSFIVLIGTIGGVDLFEPKYAFLVKNKDDFKIPLNLEQVLFNMKEPHPLLDTNSKRI